MEKISIARRHRENKETLFPIETDHFESHQEMPTKSFQRIFQKGNLSYRLLFKLLRTILRIS